MQLEIQVALNFIISYLYNKLPRRRVNIFGEELERQLKQKYDGHWYPDKPYKGSGFRCIHVGEKVDPVVEQAAKESGLDIEDVRNNLPQDLSVWIDPFEVSYQIGEKGPVKVLYVDDSNENGLELDKEIKNSFNPEAQVFMPISEPVGPSPTSSSPSPPFRPVRLGQPHLHAALHPAFNVHHCHLRRHQVRLHQDEEQRAEQRQGGPHLPHQPGPQREPPEAESHLHVHALALRPGRGRPAAQALRPVPERQGVRVPQRAGPGGRGLPRRRRAQPQPPPVRQRLRRVRGLRRPQRQVPHGRPEFQPEQHAVFEPAIPAGHGQLGRRGGARGGAHLVKKK
uniref:Anti-proliferative protein domain-containing protein n=1 Tax=Denticeps clupeoides TaxID=299321 RepID=A0AAY4C0C4_9TELE